VAYPEAECSARGDTCLQEAASAGIHSPLPPIAARFHALNVGGALLCPSGFFPIRPNVAGVARLRFRLPWHRWIELVNAAPVQLPLPETESCLNP
jgi:hypothetical protein